MEVGRWLGGSWVRFYRGGGRVFYYEEYWYVFEWWWVGGIFFLSLFALWEDGLGDYISFFMLVCFVVLLEYCRGFVVDFGGELF